jgi:hypothetical protein
MAVWGRATSAPWRGDSQNELFGSLVVGSRAISLKTALPSFLGSAPNGTNLRR